MIGRGLQRRNTAIQVFNHVQHKTGDSILRQGGKVAIDALMDAGLHLGHSTSRWNKNMFPFIYGRRAGIHIINLEHTLSHLRRAMSITRSITANGGNILFVGSRPFMLDILVSAANRSNQFYVHGKWLKGCLSNHEQTLGAMTGTGKSYLQPDLLVVLDMGECNDCIEEANSVGIPTVGLCDTDCDPKMATYCIPGNDDSAASVMMVAGLLAESARDGCQI